MLSNSFYSLLRAAEWKVPLEVSNINVFGYPWVSFSSFFNIEIVEIGYVQAHNYLNYFDIFAITLSMLYKFVEKYLSINLMQHEKQNKVRAEI